MQPASAPPVVNDAAAWSERLAAKRTGREGYFAFYSSVAGAITTNPALMAVPIDDHAVVRGHAIFDTCSLVDGRLYRLQIHLDRLFASAAAARLPLPYGADEATNRTAMTAVVRAACRACGRPTCDVRFWLTAGTGHLGVTPDGCAPAFYVLCFGGLPGLEGAEAHGIREVTVPASAVPPKPACLAEIKSNNYLLNALTMMSARERGGTFGLGVDAAGYLTESCVLNVCVVGADRVLRTPPFDGILRGTTVRRVLELARRRLVAPAAGALLAGVAQERISADDARAASEVFLCAGDTHTFAVVALDDATIGDGRPGPVHAAVARLLQDDAKSGAGNNHEPL